MSIKVVPKINKDLKEIEVEYLRQENKKLIKEIEIIKNKLNQILNYNNSSVLFIKLIRNVLYVIINQIIFNWN